MANITAALVKELRERTAAGMMDCKKALMENDGDMDKAIDWLREKGLAQAAKKAGRIAAEGAVVQYITECGTDPEAAFANWMERDALFAEDIRQQCMQAGYSCLLTDGSISPEERLAQVATHFRLD